MKTILLDVDGCIADCASVVHADAQRILGRPLPAPAQWDDFEFGPSMDLCELEDSLLHKALKHDDNLGWKIDLYPGAQEFVEELRKHTDVVFVTAHWPGMKHWVAARDNLLRHYFGDVEIIYTHHKWRVRGDHLIDDKPSTIARNRHRGLLFDQPWNRLARDLKRVYSYQEILEEVL